MLKRVLLLIPLFLCDVYGGNICCSPPQWEAVQGFSTGSVDDEGHTAITQGATIVSFDANGKRIRSVENIESSGRQEEFTILQLFAQNVQYTIKNTTCTRAKLPAWTSPNCIPGTATVVGTYRWGLTQSINVTQYSWTEGTVQINTEVTDGCVPVGTSSSGDLQGVKFSTGASFFNITLGIKDPSVFDVPASCKQAEVGNLRQTLFRRR